MIEEETKNNFTIIHKFTENQLIFKRKTNEFIGYSVFVKKEMYNVILELEFPSIFFP